MFINDVLNKCAEHGYKITKMGLYKAGKKYGFVKKIEGKHQLDFDKKVFLEWLEKATEKAPDGWVTVNQLHNILDVSIPQVYILIKDEESGVKSYGSGKGIKYVDPERIKQIIKKRENSHKEQWGEEDGGTD